MPDIFQRIYFVKIRNPHQGNVVYDSYNDYWRFVALAGFNTCELEEVNPLSQNIYIVSPNIYIPDSIFGGTAKIILWQLERTDGVPPFTVIGNISFFDERYDEIWIYDKSLLSLSGVTNKCKYVVLGGDKGLMLPVNTDKQFDFYHMSYLYGRRNVKVMAMSAQGYSFAECPYGYEGKNFNMQQCYAGLCLHQDEMKWIEPIRYAVFSCYKLPILAEYCINYEPFFTYSYEDFISKGGSVSELSNWQENYYTMTEKFTFKQCVLNALS